MRLKLIFLLNIFKIRKGIPDYEQKYMTHTRGETPFTIGGDHSIAIGSVAGSLDFYKKDVSVIWVDAHADINTYEASETKNLHGMPLSFLTGLDTSFINMNGNELLLDRLLYYGLRDVDKFEQELLDSRKYTIYDSNRIKCK